MKTQYLIMSTFTKMPSSLIQLKTKSNFLEVYTYFLIKDQFKDNSLTTSISEEELAKEVGVTNVTISKYIKDLTPYFKEITKKKNEKQEHYYNVYHFTQLKKDFSIVLHTLKDDTELTPEEKGILIKIKLVCENGTNFIKYGSKKELAKNIGIGINQINSKLQPLIDKGYLKYIGKSLHLNPIHFPLSLNIDNSTDGTTNYIYAIIYQFCLNNEVCPPLRDSKALSYLIAKYPNVDSSLKNDLVKKCSNLPKEVSLDYFIKALENKKVERKEPLEWNFII